MALGANLTDQFHRIPGRNRRKDALGREIPEMGNLSSNHRNEEIPMLRDAQGNEMRADRNKRYGDNIQGKYYCDSKCIDCLLCQEIAPENFTRNEGEMHSFVFKQPENPEEEILCKEAIKCCPVAAIGDDGE